MKTKANTKRTYEKPQMRVYELRQTQQLLTANNRTIYRRSGNPSYEPINSKDNEKKFYL